MWARLSESSDTCSSLTPGIAADRALGVLRYTNEKTKRILGLCFPDDAFGPERWDPDEVIPAFFDADSGMGWVGGSGWSFVFPEIAHSGYFKSEIGVLYVSESRTLFFCELMKLRCMRMKICQLRLRAFRHARYDAMRAGCRRIVSLSE